jgi:hypothetical protein
MMPVFLYVARAYPPPRSNAREAHRIEFGGEAERHGVRLIRNATSAIAFLNAKAEWRIRLRTGESGDKWATPHNSVLFAVKTKRIAAIPGNPPSRMEWRVKANPPANMIRILATP